MSNLLLNFLRFPKVLNFISIFVGFESQTREKKITLETMTLT